MPSTKADLETDKLQNAKRQSRGRVPRWPQPHFEDPPNEPDFRSNTDHLQISQKREGIHDTASHGKGRTLDIRPVSSPTVACCTSTTWFRRRGHLRKCHADVEGRNRATKTTKPHTSATANLRQSAMRGSHTTRSSANKYIDDFRRHSGSTLRGPSTIRSLCGRPTASVRRRRYDQPHLHG